MTQLDKLLQRIRSLDVNLRFEDLQKVLELYGYTMRSPKGGSSHYTFIKYGFQPITIPKHKPVKIIYVKAVKKAIESEE